MFSEEIRAFEDDDMNVWELIVLVRVKGAVLKDGSVWPAVETGKDDLENVLIAFFGTTYRLIMFELP